MHKDWDGPGWYDEWNENGRYIGLCEYEYHLEPPRNSKLKKLEDFKPPKPPKEELPDGVYLLRAKESGLTWMATMEKGSFTNELGQQVNSSMFDIIYRFVTEPVND